MKSHALDRGANWTGRLLVLLSALALALLPMAENAAAHGSIVDPATRNYQCFDRWGDDFQNPAMEQEDPMCWQAWQELVQRTRARQRSRR